MAIGVNWAEIWAPVWKDVWAPPAVPETPIGINWAPIWEQVWKPVWQQDEAPTYTLTADAGAFVLAGSGAYSARVVDLDVGAFTVNGQDAVLTYSPAPGSYVLTAEAGAFVLGGQDATFPRDYVLHASPGTFTFTGYNANESGTSATTGVPGKPGKKPGGRASRYVIYIDGEPFVGTESEIQQAVEVLAQNAAEKAISSPTKKARKPAIVVKSGKAVAKSLPLTEQRQEQREVQTQVRDMYAEAYQTALMQLEQQNDDDEAMILMF